MVSLARIGLYSQLLLGCAPLVHFARAAELRILVHDCSGINRRTIEKSASELRRILRFADADVDVTGCRDEANPSSPESSKDPTPLELWILRGRAKTPREGGREPLGYSVVRGRGGRAFIFAEAVLAEALAADVPWSVLIAYTAAHEIGHLVLGLSHSETGMMKPIWDLKDFQAMYRNSVHFSTEQQRLVAAFFARSREVELAQKR